MLSLLMQSYSSTRFLNANGALPTSQRRPARGRSRSGRAQQRSTGVTSFAVLGPGGAVLGSTLSRMVRTHLVPLAVAGVFAGALDKVGSTIGSTVTGIVILPFSLTASGLQALVSLCNGPQFDKSALLKDEEYLKTLQSLPDDVFSSENKTVVANTFGIR